jgi:hypothetical protein
MTRATLRSAVRILITLAAPFLWAQTQPSSSAPGSTLATPPPQSPREALIEMFFGDKPDHLERHLPDAARKAFKQTEDGSNKSFLNEISSLGMMMKAGGGQSFHIMDTGPILISAEDPRNQKVEIVVERDELVGEEDQIELSIHMYENGQQQTLPVLPRLTFSMKSEAKIWRLNEINISARVPLGDEDYLKDLVKNIKEKQQRSNETSADFTIQNIVKAENSWHASHPDRPYLCSLSELAKVEVDEQAGTEQRHYRALSDEVGSGKQNGYVFALSGCDAAHFKAVAEPATPNAGKRAFCADESGRFKSSNDGKATTCLTHGEEGWSDNEVFTAVPQ